MIFIKFTVERYCKKKKITTIQVKKKSEEGRKN